MPFIRYAIAFFLLLLAFLLRKKRKAIAVIIIIPALVAYGYIMYELLLLFKRVAITNALDYLLKVVLVEDKMSYAIEVLYFTLFFAFMAMVFNAKKYLRSIIFVVGVLAFIFIGSKFISDAQYIYLFNIAFALLFTIFCCFQKNYVWVILGILSLGFVFVVQFELCVNTSYNLFMNFNYLTLIVVSGMLVSLGFVELGCGNND